MPAAHVFVDELVRAGVAHACVMPGSRSTPLALALARHDGLRAWSHVDERSGAFFALGLAKASRRPVVVACTSGTAAANLLPAVVEAFHAQVPLIVLTADRPPELRDCGAGQTIDQLKLFGGFVRWFVEVGTPEATPAAERWVRTPRRARHGHGRRTAGGTGAPELPVPRAAGPRPGAALRPDAERRVDGGRPGDARAEPRCHSDARRGPRRRTPPARRLRSARRSRSDAASRRRRARDGARRSGRWRSPHRTSGARRSLPLVVDAHDAVLRVDGFTDAHPPDAVVRLGAPPTSKALATWLARHDDALQIVVDGSGQWPEPAGVATTLLRGRPSAVCTALATAMPVRPASDWAPRWRRAGAAARAALTEALARETAPFEAHAVARSRPRAPGGGDAVRGQQHGGARPRRLLARRRAAACASWRIAAPTASTASSPACSAPPPRAPVRSSVSAATSPSTTT